MRKITNKPKSDLQETISTVDTSTQTPIEIALQIDENGMTTASNLYSFLELHPASFSRWCNTNIKNNKFAVENEDYIPFSTDVERHNPKPKTDYKLTSEFAKKLSMTGNTERHEQARQYFIACEQGLKVATKRLQDNPNNQLTQELVTTLSSINDRLSKLEESIQKKKLPEKRYSRWKSNTFNKLRKLQEYVNENSDEQLTLPNIIHLVIGETEDTYNIEINDYVDLYKSEMDLEDNPYAIDVINHYKDIRDMFALTLDSIMEKLHIQENRECNKRNIFDELAERLEKEN